MGDTPQTDVTDNTKNKNKEKPQKRWSVRRIGDNKYFNAFFSVIVASLLWVSVNTYINPPTETEFRVQLTAKNRDYLKENSLLLQDDSSVPSYVVVTSQGRQEDLDKLSITNFWASFDYANVKSADDKEIKIDLEILNVDANIKVNYSPEKVSVRLENEITVAIPVVNNYVTGEVKSGYTLTGITLSENEHSFTGAESVVGKYSHLETQIDVSGMSGDEVRQVNCVLFDTTGAEVRPIGGEVRVTANLEVSKEVNLEVETIGNVDEYYYVDSINVSPDKVMLHGPSRILESIEHLSTEIIDIEKASKDISVSRKIIVPDGTKIYPSSLSETDIEIIILREESRQITLSLENVDILSRSPGMNYEIQQNEIKIVLIGKTADFQQFDPDGFITSVNVAGLNEGVHNVLLKITPQNNLTVYGDYTVDVTIRNMPTNGRGTSANTTTGAVSTTAAVPTETDDENAESGVAGNSENPGDTDETGGTGVGDDGNTGQETADGSGETDGTGGTEPETAGG